MKELTLLQLALATCTFLKLLCPLHPFPVLPSPYQGTFVCMPEARPGPQVIFRPHPTYPLMQSSDAVVGYSSVAVDVSLVVVASSCAI